MYVSRRYVYTYLRKCVRSYIYVCTCTHTFVRVCVGPTCACACVRTYVDPVRTYVCHMHTVCVCLYECVYAFVHVCVACTSCKYACGYARVCVFLHLLTLFLTCEVKQTRLYGADPRGC